MRVGSGSSGAVVANRLSEDFRVLLLEAGGDPHPLTQIPALSFLLLNRDGMDWNYRTVSQRKACFAMPKQQCSWPRGKALGGSTNLNFMTYARGSPYDYDNWANRTGEPKWKYDNLLRYFKRSENYRFPEPWDNFTKEFHSTKGPMEVSLPAYQGLANQFVNAGKESGFKIIDYNAPFHEGFAPFLYTQKRGRRMGTYQAFLEPIRDRKSLTVRKFAHVNKLLMRDDSDEIYGVEYQRHGQRRIARADKEVILSAGALNSPKILMLSGIGPKEHLESFGIKVRKSLPVGKNLQDHVSTSLGPFLINKPISFNMDRDINTNTIADFVLDGRGPLSSTGMQATGFIASSFAKKRGEAHWPDLQWTILGNSVYKNYGKDNEYAFNVKEGYLQKYYRNAQGQDSFQIINILNRPLSRGEVLLKSKDPKDPPLIDPKYFDKADDVKILVESLKRTVELVENSTSFKELGATLIPHSLPGCESFKFKTDAYYECFARSLTLTMYHPAGTNKMGKKDSKEAVVDPQLRVIGIKKLRVIDASIMPNIVASDINAACMMIGELGATFIKGDYLT
ncbi:Glucose dehydrogenase [FAD, quinone] [Orchesella cincta]|uniref:Glucose dehydrogenase [FAD, quinone] n=1 Tax=Orchesella cincta TaxID=48709 RepID=A0A1D2MN00_ORCCI|nr:Glucose dehydrogenase [FAD, quinone] [Orchesella cincta]